LPRGFIPSEDAALRKLVEDYETASRNTIDLSIVPFVALRQKEVAAIISGVVPELWCGAGRDNHSGRKNA
jgi:hypothetical protein